MNDHSQELFELRYGCEQELNLIGTRIKHRTHVCGCYDSKDKHRRSYHAIERQATTCNAHKGCEHTGENEKLQTETAILRKILQEIRTEAVEGEYLIVHNYIMKKGFFAYIYIEERRALSENVFHKHVDTSGKKQI